MIELDSLWLTLRLASLSTAILMVLATPLAYWLATTKAGIKPIVEAVTALPLILPPTVLGFYLLILFSPSSAFGSLWVQVTGQTLSFSFTGILLASVVHSFPFAVQPMQTAFENNGRRPAEVAQSLGASPFDAFITVTVPMARRGFLTAAVLGFAHSVGEFGVILLVGGNIPGRTRVISIDIYTHVETLDYASAHFLSMLTLCFAMLVLSLVFIVNRRYPIRT
ncbi:MAG: molybdate ABC transporter permease subunit [Rhodobacteraceae bacterium]|nr:molybdate ABC transporter permease subunit [Paracoccaceae bacterium]